jgi:integrase
VQWYDHNGKRRTKCTRTTDKATAERIAAKFDADTALRRDGVVDVAQERFALEGRRPIAEHVADFRAALAAKGNTSKHVEMTDARVKRVITTSGAAHVPDLTPSTVQQVIKGIHDTGRSLETANSYLRAIKSFSRWLWRDRRTVGDPLVTLAGYNASTEDSRHARREVTPDELTYLLAFVERHTLAAHKLPGPDRAVLYRVALGTGFRVNELRSLTPASFSLDSNPPTVTVEAAYSKRRRRDVQPIRRDLADLLGPWLEERAGDELGAAARQKVEMEDSASPTGARKEWWLRTQVPSRLHGLLRRVERRE